MTLLTPAERRFAETISCLSFSNPFLPERVELERQALGDQFREEALVWSKRSGMEQQRANVTLLLQWVTPLVEDLRSRIESGRQVLSDEWPLFDDLVLYHLYHRFWEDIWATIEQFLVGDGQANPRVECWSRFRQEFDHYLMPPGRPLASEYEAAHTFACYFQVCRAFHHIFHYVVGESMPAARLRVAIWQSIFTHDMRRYRRTLHRHLGDVATLICGPSGTGKELVARAVGLSRYIPLDARSGRFAEDFASSFHPLNLSALSPTLIESELFGHCRGAFTGAVGDRAGWLEQCSPLGTVFLDEIGDLSAAIQVKLLRVLQTRTFQRLGETTPRSFAGKIIAATNRDLSTEMRCGRFREDFYYRLCADIVHTPSLSEQLRNAPHDLPNLLRYLADRIAGEEAEALAAETKAWIENHLGPDYGWPGNIRELEQCLRNVMIHGRYQPPRAAAGSSDPLAALAVASERGTLSAEDLLRRYCTWTYAREGSYEQAAKRLGLDRRTLKGKVDEHLLPQMRRQVDRPTGHA